MMAERDLPQLPVSDVLASLGAALETNNSAVLVAPPGAGKTTLVPLYLLDAPWRKPNGKIILLEPRRLAARAAARRMASILGEDVGQTIGFRMRLETRVSAATQIEVVTEGVFQRMILDDPELTGISAILFDEFHERSLDADFGLALALDVQGALRDNLRLLVMSATLDGARVAALLDDAPVIESKGRAFPVEMRYEPRGPNERIEEAMARAIRQTLANETGSILAFLPGQGEIRRTAELIEARLPADSFVAPLFGAMDIRDQDRAIAPPPDGKRKVVLATALAESSITIDGVRIVIDSGLARVPVFEPAFGVARLDTVRVSRASADQRAGRAGRTQPGIALRLWAEPQTAALAAFDTPEILSTDLSRLVLDAAGFGVGDPSTLRFLDPPPAPALAEARNLLVSLGAMDEAGRVTEKGEAIAKLGMGVREAAVIAEGGDADERVARARLALLLSERGLGGTGIDLDDRLRRLASEKGDRAVRVRAMAARIAGAKDGQGEAADGAGVMLLAGFADRVAKARAGQPGHFVMANGRGAFMDETERLAASPYLVIADLTGQAARARIQAAAAISEAEILTHLGHAMHERETMTYDTSRRALLARKERRLGRLVLASQPSPVKAGEAATEALIAAVEKHGADILPWEKETLRLRDRLAWLHAVLDEPWPAVDDETLAGTAGDWLAPWLAGKTGFADWRPGELRDALLARVDYAVQARLDALAPSHFEVPTGSRIPLDYPRDGSAPVLAVRVQELFGLTQHPAIADGRVPLTLELLSPAHRPIQRTTDLPTFWRGSWAEVRAEMRGRYPRHPWPENPADAPPTRRAKPRGT